MDMLLRLTGVRKRNSSKRLFAFWVVLTTIWILPIDVGARTNALCSYAGLTELTEFGDNPGNLKAYYYKPNDLAPNAPLVVAMHGCGQNACDYDDETGWKALAEKFQFALLCSPSSNSSPFGFHPLAIRRIASRGGKPLTRHSVRGNPNRS